MSYRTEITTVTMYLTEAKKERLKMLVECHGRSQTQILNAAYDAFENLPVLRREEFIKAAWRNK